MNPSIYAASAFSSGIIIAMIYYNYYQKTNTDVYQRKLFMAVLFAAFAAIIADFISSFFMGRSGTAVHILVYISKTILLITQNCAYYLCAVFIDYFTYKNAERSKKLLITALVLLTLYSVSIILNLHTGWYFTVSAGNHYTREKLYPLRLAISYSSILLIIIDILVSLRYFKHSHAYLIIMFVLIVGLGASMDIIMKEGSLVWPCFSAAVLYLYFLVIQTDSKIDSLTRIGNRASFNEFIYRLSRQNTKTDYSIVMIDMDRFKEINDNLGHTEGDNALRDLAAIIRSCIRHSDFAARYGGDEFILAAGAEYDMEKLMGRIQEAIDNQNKKRVRPYQIYISYGYDVFTTNSGQSIYAFLAKIDAMMYKQKEEHKKMGIPSALTSQIP